VVEPWEVFSTGGQWYLSAHCHRATGPRLFRLDRVMAAEPLHSAATEPRPRRPPRPATWSPRPDDPVVVLDIGPGARWVAEQYPNEGVEERPAGALRVRLRVSGEAWLERLLLRLGPDADVVEGPAEAGRRAAVRLLERYRAE
jgi:proteasome accessory factor C